MTSLLVAGLSLEQLFEIRDENSDYRLLGDESRARLYIAASERILNHSEFHRGSHAGEELEMAPELIDKRLKRAYQWLESRGKSRSFVRYADLREYRS
jgi:hypothetical protein